MVKESITFLSSMLLEESLLARVVGMKSVFYFPPTGELDFVCFLSFPFTYEYRNFLEDRKLEINGKKKDKRQISGEWRDKSGALVPLQGFYCVSLYFFCSSF